MSLLFLMFHCDIYTLASEHLFESGVETLLFIMKGEFDIASTSNLHEMLSLSKIQVHISNNKE